MDPRNPRAVIIYRDENNGYGLTVCGDNPVLVQTIKPGGAADRGKICVNDIIVKVNGSLVEHMNHSEVVDLIKSAGPYVTLTVRTPGPEMTGMPVGIVGNSSGRQTHHGAMPHERTVTAPLPVDRGVQLQMQDNKFRTLQVYRDQAAAEFEAAWKKYESTQSQRDKSEVEKAEKSLRSIEAQMKKFRQSSPNLQLHSPTPFNPYPQSHQSIQFNPFAHQQLDYHPHQGFHHRHPPAPPAPPNRNRNALSAQISVPPFRWDHHQPDMPPPLPPRSASQTTPFTQPHDLRDFGPPDYSPFDPLGQSGTNSQAYFQSNNLNMMNSRVPSTSSTNINPSHNQSHHRAKSSPDPVSMQKALSYSEEGTSKLRSDSVNDLSKGSSIRSNLDALDARSGSSVPSGSPPPPYGVQRRSTVTEDLDMSAEQPFQFNTPGNSGGGSDLAALLVSGHSSSTTPGLGAAYSPGDIMSMEEDDCLIFHDSPNTAGMGKNGPWSSLAKLLDHNAHLAVFMNYVVGNNCDPSSLLFYLITGRQMEEGTLKEMKRWGYEIHSTFTAPGSPLHVPHVAENIALEIDDNLNLIRESDKQEMMRRVFGKARIKAKEEINKQLEEFCTKKTAGLGTMFGPPDSMLEECLVDKAKETKVIETYLIPRLDSFCEEYEKTGDDRTLAIINAVSTILQKQFLVRPNSSSNAVLERCGSFVSKEKSVKARFMSRHKKITHNGHHFSPQLIYSYTVCNICGKILWGVAPQGLQCSDCNIYVHRNCVVQIQDACVGAEAEGLKKKDRLRQIKDKIRSKSDAPKRRSAVNPLRRNLDDNFFFPNHSASFPDFESGDKPLSSSGSSSNNLKSSDKRPDTLSEERLTQDGSTYEDEANDHRPSQEPRRSSNIVGRSESCKERPQRKQPRERERRKHSDPNLTSKSSDVDLDSHRILSDANNSSASNSSLSARSSDSPSTSLELVAPHHSSSSLPGRHSETPETGHGDYRPTQQSWEGDSDIEVEQDPPDWTKEVPEDILSQLESHEKKRQEVLNELFHTERSHVRHLKVVDRLFHRPIRTHQLLPPELIQMLFASWEDMLDVHGKFNTALKRKRLENPLIGDIGPLLLETFDGDAAENFKKAAAACCARQQIGLKALKERREKSPKLNAFLQEAEQDPVCRRLQIQDMIPMVMQRLTKYPLIFSKLCHYSSSDPESEAHKAIQRALEMSKEILNSVNHSKKEAEDNQRLLEIQSRLDKSALEKGILSLEKGVDKPDTNFINELRNLDLTAHKLIHEGPLHWKFKSNKQKSEVLQDVQLVLLHDMVVILLKQDDRFILKIHSSPSFTGKSERVTLRPVIKLNNLIIRANAADKKAFMLINMTSSNMYDLVCSSTEERKQWLHHITKAAEDYKSRQESRRSDFHPSPSIPVPVPEPEERKETNDVSESGEGGSEPESSGGQDCLLLGTSPKKEPSPGPMDMRNDIPGNSASPDTSLAGNEKEPLSRHGSTASSPNPNRRVGEFLRVTETSPLIEPSEVVITSRDVQFAQPVISAHEELKRLDLSISKALGDKMNLASQMLHIPLNSGSGSNSSGEEIGSGVIEAKDSKELVVACMNEVDKLRKTICEQSRRAENLVTAQEQAAIATSLAALLHQILGEISRKDEELEGRRQELHRLREQNHGYQERLQKVSNRTKKSSTGSDPSMLGSSSPILNSQHTRPTCLVPRSSPASDHREDEDLDLTKRPSKLQSSATYNCNSAVPHLVDSSAECAQSSTQSHLSDLACELATEEYADALNGSDSWTESEKMDSAEPNDPSTQEHSESESEEYLMQASTLTLVPDAEEIYVNVTQPTSRDSESTKPSNGFSLDASEGILATQESGTKNCTNGETGNKTTAGGED